MYSIYTEDRHLSEYGKYDKLDERNFFEILLVNICLKMRFKKLINAKCRIHTIIY